MKKSLLFLVLTFVLCFFFAGCGKKPIIILNDENVDLIVGDEYQIDYKIENEKEGLEVVATTTSDLITITEDMKITAIKAGTATVSVMIKDKKKTTQTLTVNIQNKYISNIELTAEPKIVIGAKTQASVAILPEDATIKDIVWSTSDEKVITVDTKGEVTAVGVGKAKLIATTQDGSNKVGELMITVVDIDEVKPTLSIDEKLTTQDVTIGYNIDFDPMYGIIATDDVDGDVKDSVTIDGKVDTHRVGEYKLTYKVADFQENESEPLTRTINVVWDSKVTFIGHGGCYSSAFNSKEAYEKAFTVHGYQGIECDVKQTQDGVFVTSHGDEWMGKTLDKTNWDDLKNLVNEGYRGDTHYAVKLCTFREYLQVAKKYGGFCVVELKWSKGINNNDTSRMGALMKEIEEEGMLHNVIFLASQYKCLEWVRAHGYDYIPCQYLVGSADDRIIFERCVKNNFDISFNIASTNTIDWIDRYHEAGLKVACYTFSQNTDEYTLQSWIDKGVDYVTVDKMRPYEVKLPRVSDPEPTRHTVTFKDFDGSVIKTTNTVEGRRAVDPFEPLRGGYKFTGWDKDINNITAPLEVTAQYVMETYNITYKANPVMSKVVEWKDKEEFVDEFYTDWFNWLSTKAGKIDGFTKSGNTYKFTRYGKTAEWTDVASMKALGPYEVERTIGAYVYKPTNRLSFDEKVIPEEDNNYFLNTEPYRNKYIAMDAYFIQQGVKLGYASYSMNFEQASNGRVQILFRFHQWACKNTTIHAFDKLPTKVDMVPFENVHITLPTTNLQYNVEDDFALPTPTCPELVFTGWYTDAACTKKVEKISKGMYGDLELYAGWTTK